MLTHVPPDEGAVRDGAVEAKRPPLHSERGPDGWAFQGLLTLGSGVGAGVATRCGNDAGIPAGGSTTRRRADVGSVVPGASQQPGHERVRVPHLTRAQLVATPGAGWELLDKIEDPSGCVRIAADRDGPAHSGDQVRDRPARPAADLVAEQPRPSQELGADGSLRYDPSVTALRPHRRHLDDGGHATQSHFERGVKEAAAGPPSKCCCHDLVEPAAPLHDDTACAGAQGDPVQIDAIARRVGMVAVALGDHGRHSAGACTRREAAGCLSVSANGRRMTHTIGPELTFRLTRNAARPARTTAPRHPVGGETLVIDSLIPAPMSQRWPDVLPEVWPKATASRTLPPARCASGSDQATEWSLSRARHTRQGVSICSRSATTEQCPRTLTGVWRSCAAPPTAGRQDARGIVGVGRNSQR